MTKTNYRHMAREALARARTELAANEQVRLRYAGLELREVLEALTYDRAKAYEAEFPPEEYKVWQPRKLMASLLDIDPHAQMTSTIAIGEQDDPGVPAPRERMKVIGTDHPLSLAVLKDHYDALGSFLHVQSPTGQEPDWSKLRTRCEAIVSIANTVLSSRVWNSTFGNFAHLDECLNPECKKPIRKRIPPGVDTFETQCFECKAAYTVTSQPDGKILFEPKMVDVRCSNSDCTRVMALWPHEIQQGTNWKCQECGTHSELVLGVAKVEG